MTREDAIQLANALREAWVDAEEFSDLNLWCVKIKSGPWGTWCSVIGDGDSITWGPDWQFYLQHHGVVAKAVAGILRTTPAKSRLKEPKEKS